MVTVILDPAANNYLDQAYARHRLLGERIDDALDGLERDPGDARWRRSRLQLPGHPELGSVWKFTVRAGDDDVMVIWHEDADAMRVIFIGPDTL